MLGRVKAERTWQWGAYGKQPWARDYFKIGTAFPLLNSFADWIEKGYSVIAGKKTSAEKQNSWRFWTRDARQDHVVCGVVRDSVDGVGRPYPFLMIGSGPLDGWEKRWELLPFVFNNVWGQVEYLSTRMYSDSRVFEMEVSSIRPPAPEWARYEEERGQIAGSDLSAAAPQFSGQQKEGFLRIGDRTGDYSRAAGVYHEAIKRCTNGPPNAVFMGGTLDRTCFAHFRRPLTTADFARLWLAEDV